MFISIHWHRLILCTFILSAGCTEETSRLQPSPPAAQPSAMSDDPHDVPMTDAEKEAVRQSLTTYAKAITVIVAHRNKIRDAINAGKPATAHRSLDELDIVLDHLPTVARNDQIPKSHWESINTTAQAMRDLFNQVHSHIDAGQEPQFEAIAADVEAAIAQLQSVTDDLPDNAKP